MKLRVSPERVEEKHKIMGVPSFPQAYYQKKRLEGKTHNQAIRALGGHLSRVIFKMLKETRGYIIPH